MCESDFRNLLFLVVLSFTFERQLPVWTLHIGILSPHSLRGDLPVGCTPRGEGRSSHLTLSALITSSEWQSHSSLEGGAVT